MQCKMSENADDGPTHGCCLPYRVERDSCGDVPAADVSLWFTGLNVTHVVYRVECDSCGDVPAADVPLLTHRYVKSGLVFVLNAEIEICIQKFVFRNLY